ncbi:hypothetical protein VC83_09489 [Pseudogymnoascus destructans]|uniref:HORMA domain-containing protein n=2 Tax=Pseudogymnoascus destructans TaxID=655981 RepID=L8FMF3_PSED2|nr:uncharacterized protein VC83_09489 [Pseudogymnoascus destructans]ELR02110.1 hypothetical protein GMDG_05270 [Pseudogymnoascus destructans 20631-21]OAF54232.1 hypothetical protein VC83_09489 [Pseudogymnoascus destructans]
MPAPPPPPIPILNTYTSLLRTLTSFLTVAIHTLLYERALYPPTSFISARAYNYPVRQSRHPKVCEWVSDVVAAVEKEMAEGRVDKISFVVYDVADRRQAVVQERWVFDVGAWPVVAMTDRFVQFEEPVRGKGKGVEMPVREEEGDREKEGGEEVKIHIVDIEEQLRATIRRLAYTAEKMPPLPEGCTYTVIVELRDDATPPIGHPQPWVPSPPALQKTVDKETDTTTEGPAIRGPRATPIRSVDSGAFVLETWVEQAAPPPEDKKEGKKAASDLKHPRGPAMRM